MNSSPPSSSAPRHRGSTSKPTTQRGSCPADVRGWWASSETRSHGHGSNRDCQMQGDRRSAATGAPCTAEPDAVAWCAPRGRSARSLRHGRVRVGCR
jgi:hypothetical protein